MPPRLLTLNASDKIEGDINTMLLALANFAPEDFTLTAVSVPRGKTYEKLCALPQVRVIPMEMGGLDARPDGDNRRKRMVEFAQSLPRLIALVRREKIDVLYTIDRTLVTKQAALVSRVTGVPFVLNSAYPFYPLGGRGNRWALKQARRIHVHSDYLRRHIAPHAASPDRITKVMNGIQIERYDPTYSGVAARQDLGLAPDTPLVVMAGRLNPYKGQDDLIDAAEIILRTRPDAHFVIAGGDEQTMHEGAEVSMRSLLEARIAAKNVGHRVRLAGYYPDLPGLMAAADMVAMPSWEEPFGLVALEGMAMAKPIVSTRAGGVPEFVLEGETGLLVPPRDPQALAHALLTLMAHPERARRMGALGRTRVEQFHTAQHYTAGVAQALNAALATSR